MYSFLSSLTKNVNFIGRFFDDISSLKPKGKIKADFNFQDN